MENRDMIKVLTERGLFYRKIPIFLFFLFIGILMISFVSSYGYQITEKPLLIYKQGESINLLQTCSNCSYLNITKIILGNKTIINLNKEMTKDGSVYNYTFNNTDSIGVYVINGIGDDNGEDSVWAYNIKITPSGFLNTLGFYLLILLFSFGLIILGLVIRDAPITILGSIGLYFLGFYILFFGLVDLKDTTYTWAISIILLGLAFYISTKSSVELITN